MTRYLTLLSVILCFFFGAGVFDAAAHNHSEKEAKAIGVHGMALFGFEDKIFASHMPLHHSIHSHQVVLEVQLPEDVAAQLKQRLKQRELFSIAPEVFDLFEIKNNQLTNFSAKIFQGHFERGGKVIADDIDIRINDVLLFEPIKAEKNGDFYLLKLSDNASLAVHQIGPLASYDQIFGLKGTLADKVKLASGSDRPIDKLALSKMLQLNKEDTALLYLETQDFSNKNTSNTEH